MPRDRRKPPNPIVGIIVGFATIFTGMLFVVGTLLKYVYFVGDTWKVHLESSNFIELFIAAMIGWFCGVFGTFLAFKYYNRLRKRL